MAFLRRRSFPPPTPVATPPPPFALAPEQVRRAISLFPLSTPPYPAQVDAIQRVLTAFESGKRFVVLEGPPGVGKSAIAVTVARYYGGAFCCTATKQLQDQYIEDFARLGARELKGRTNFPCPRCGSTCETGGKRFTDFPCGLEEYEVKGETIAPCAYKVAKARALAALVTVCNYSSYFWNVYASFVPVPRRPLTILDEGHSVEEKLLEFISITVDLGDLPFRPDHPLPDATEASACFSWLQYFVEHAREILRQDEPRPREERFLGEQQEEELRRLVSKATFALGSAGREQWLSEPLPGVEHRPGFVLKPLTVRSFGDRLFDHGDRILLMSATILDADMVCDSVGIPREERAFVQMPCTFPVENRPIYYWDLTTTRRGLQDSWPEVIDLTVQALDRHPKEKGLILTPSNEMIHRLLRDLPREHARRLVPAYGDDRDAGLDRHRRSTGPTVLAASGCWEGVDLKDDLSRFCIIPAVPRASFRGQIQARAIEDRRWYDWRTFCKLIQGTGRSVRHGEDYAFTYCFDEDLFLESQRGEESLLPEWFRDALVPGASLDE